MNEQKEMVNHPDHYNHPVECIDAMEMAYGTHAVYHFCLCNAFKYRYRAGHKAGECNGAVTDLAKAKWYDDKAKQLYSKIIDNKGIDPAIV